MSNKNININFGNLQENNPLYLSKLSSFSLTEFNLDGKNWYSPIHYMCMNIIKSSGIYGRMRDTRSPYVVLNIFEENYPNYEERMLIEKLKEGIYSLCGNNQDLKNTLLSTGQKDLYYSDEKDLYLGWQNGKPSGNLLGKAYMEVRKKLQFEEQQEKQALEETRRVDEIIQLRKIIKILQKMLFAEFNDLHDYVDLSYNDLLQNSVIKKELENFYYPDITLLDEYYNQKLEPAIYDLITKILSKHYEKDDLVKHLRILYREKFLGLIKGKNILIKRKFFMKTIFEQLSGKQLSPEDIDNQYFAWIAGQYNLDDTEQSPDKMSAKEILNKTISEIDDIVAKDSDLSKSKELRDSLKVWNDSESDNMFNIQTEQ